ncbi:MAG TPA: FlgD immunoglobulin-like domain containing protein [Acidobacteriota bacterium]|nr:FlgD immunoglobulin-like domain containing protein [Acidobacteriota bacterium]
MARPFASGIAYAIGTVALLGGLAASNPAHAGWATYGNPASLADSNQVLPKSIPDGSGGVFLVWEDRRSGNSDVYAQHLDAVGTRLWGANGVPVIVHTGGQESPVLVSDGGGGLIVAWQDSRDGGVYDIYAQALNAAGATRWAADGVAICTASGAQILQVGVSDGLGGAIFAWRDSRGIDQDVYAQRIDNAGTVLWATDGEAVCTASGTQTDMRILPDQLGGAFIVWRDRRAGLTSDIYAQRVNGSGDPQWTPDGVPVTVAANDQLSPQIVSDGRFGFIATWHDNRTVLADYNIYAQRIGPTGAPKWTVNGVLVTEAALQQQFPLIATDEKAGAIVAWLDTRNGIGTDVFAQRVDSLGVRLWGPSDGLAVCATDSTQAVTTVVSDGLGGAIFGWDDDRAGFREVFAQRVNGSGVVQWASLGLKIATGVGNRNLKSASPDGSGGCIFSWEDFRSTTSSDIYAFRVTSIGTGVEAPEAPAAAARLYPARPNPFNPHTVLSFQLDRPGDVRLALYDVRGRLVRELVNGDRSAGRHEVAWDGTDASGRGCASGVYFLQLRAEGVRRQTAVTLLR